MTTQEAGNDQAAGYRRAAPRREAWEEFGPGSTGESRHPRLTPGGLYGKASTGMNPMAAGPFIALGTGGPARGAADPDARLL